MSLPIVAPLMWSGLESESAKQCLSKAKREMYKSNCHTLTGKIHSFSN